MEFVGHRLYFGKEYYFKRSIIELHFKTHTNKETYMLQLFCISIVHSTRTGVRSQRYE